MNLAYDEDAVHRQDTIPLNLKTNEIAGVAMVTIDPDKSIAAITDLKKVRHRANTHKGEFDAVFRQAIDSTSIRGAKTESAPLTTDIRPAQFMSAPMPSTEMVVDQVQKLVETMTSFQKKLTDEGATLKEIHPLVEKMASQSSSLAALSAATGKQERLNTIVNQSLMLASMEIAKFKSGHYTND